MYTVINSYKSTISSISLQLPTEAPTTANHIRARTHVHIWQYKYIMQIYIGNHKHTCTNTHLCSCTNIDVCIYQMNIPPHVYNTQHVHTHIYTIYMYEKHVCNLRWRSIISTHEKSLHNIIDNKTAKVNTILKEHLFY